MRKGLRIRSNPNICPEIKQSIYILGKWMRRRFEFPIRVVVYLKEEKGIISSTGEEVSATFFAPYQKSEEPYIKIATGDYEEMVRTCDEGFAIYPYLVSMAHEIVHYQQWLDDRPFDEEEAERESERIVDNFIEQTCEEIRLFGEKVNRRNFHTLIKLFKTGLIDLQISVIEALSSYYLYKEAEEFLLKSITHSNEHIRAEAFCSLVTFGSNKVIQASLKGTKDSSELVKCRANECLGFIGENHNKVIHALAQSLEDSSPLVRGYASVSIGRLGVKKYYRKLKECLRTEESELAIIRYCYALFLLGDKEMLGRLIAFAYHPEPEIRIPTIQYLAEIGAVSHREKIISVLEDVKRNEKDSEVFNLLKDSLRDVNNS